MMGLAELTGLTGLTVLTRVGVFMERLEEAEFFFGGAEGFFADAGLFAGGASFGGGGAVLHCGLVLLAFDFAFGEFHHRADEAGEFVGVGKEGSFQVGRVELDEEFANVGGEELEDGLRDLAAVLLFEEVEGEVALFFEEFDLLLIFKPILEAASAAPGAEVGFINALGLIAKTGEDFVVRDAVVDHQVDLVARGFGQFGYVAVAAAANLKYWLLLLLLLLLWQLFLFGQDCGFGFSFHTGLSFLVVAEDSFWSHASETLACTMYGARNRVACTTNGKIFGKSFLEKALGGDFLPAKERRGRKGEELRMYRYQSRTSQMRRAGSSRHCLQSHADKIPCNRSSSFAAAPVKAVSSTIVSVNFMLRG
jgi:hypothetical protein